MNTNKRNSSWWVQAQSHKATSSFSSWSANISFSVIVGVTRLTMSSVGIGTLDVSACFRWKASSCTDNKWSATCFGRWHGSGRMGHWFCRVSCRYFPSSGEKSFDWIKSTMDGSLTLSLFNNGRKYPSARVIGTDLSAIQPVWYGHPNHKLLSITLVW